MADNEAVHDSHTKAAERERDEARAALSACQERAKRREDDYEDKLEDAETALSACQEELARATERAERFQRWHAEVSHEKEAAEAARDELARNMREMVDRCRDALSSEATKGDGS